jgi:heat shock protein HslJ
MPRSSLFALTIISLTACAPKDAPPPGMDSTTVTPVPVAATMPLPASPVGSWRWVSIVTPVETIQAPATGEYTLVIGDSTATGVADCNRMTGKAAWTDKQLTLGPMAMTRMACPPGGLGDRYAKFLGGAAGWFYRTDTLFVDLMVDSGTMRFVRTE